MFSYTERIQLGLKLIIGLSLSLLIGSHNIT